MLDMVIIVPCIIISLAVLLATIIWGIWLNNRHNMKLEELEKYKLHLQTRVNDIPTMLEDLINESFIDYNAKYLASYTAYITEEKEKEIRTELIDVILARMSDVVLEKLYTYYNPKEIGSILADKIYILVSEYTIQHNEKILNK